VKAQLQKVVVVVVVVAAAAAAVMENQPLAYIPSVLLLFPRT
jgi:hypothetical protein